MDQWLDFHILNSFQVENLEDIKVQEINAQKVNLAEESQRLFLKEAVKSSQQKARDLKLQTMILYVLFMPIYSDLFL